MALTRIAIVSFRFDTKLVQTNLATNIQPPTFAKTTTAKVGQEIGRTSHNTSTNGNR